MVKTVTVIPQRKKLYSVSVEQKQQKRRVAAYARVSTDSEEQLTSYEAQSIIIRSSYRKMKTGSL